MIRFVRSFGWIQWVLVVCAVLFVVVLKYEGILLAGAILAIVAMTKSYPPNEHERRALIRSISFTADELKNTLESYETFLYSGSPDALADRTLQRPALTDPDCPDPDIQAFYYESSSARRFLNRLDVRLRSTNTIKELEALLSVADRRAAELEWRWTAARQAALRLGTGYKRGQA